VQGRTDMKSSVWIVRAALIAVIITAVLVTAALAFSVAMMVRTILRDGQWIDVVPWALSVVGELAIAGWALALYGTIRLIDSAEFTFARTAGRLARLETLAADQSSSLRELVGLASLSDQAKSLLFRDREIEVIREIVHEDLMRQEYETAEALIDNVEKQLRYVEEAARLRSEVAASRSATTDEKIDAAVRRVETIIDRKDWDRAGRETRRLLERFPDQPQIAALPERIQNARVRHKRGLLQAYGEAVRKNDIDRSIELLRELDTYLTPQEAAALEDSARGVFRAKLHNLGVQFAICVTEERWSDAIATGEQIVNEYPNSQMAHEVRQKMPQLTARATMASERSLTG